MRVPRYIGTDDVGKHVELPPDAATQGFAILGKRGRGKSTLAADIMEIFAAEGIPIVVFDPPGAHWGLRFAAGDNGEPVGPSGFDVLLIGGQHGDIPLDQTRPEDLARIIVETNLSCIIDLKALSYTALQRYYATFAEELFKLNRTVRHLFFEEAQNVAPQQLKFDEQKNALYATEKLIDEGRGIGLGFSLISQRPAAINKSVLTQVDNMMSLGMFAPQDIDQVEDWFKHHVKGDKEKLRLIVDDIAGMRMGECWLLSPDRHGLMVKFNVRQRVTFHAGRTPKPGERAVNVDKFSVTEAVTKLRGLFQKTQVKRNQEVADLGEAKRRIRELELQIKKVPVVQDHSLEMMKTIQEYTKAYGQKIAELRAAFESIQRISAHYTHPIELVVPIAAPKIPAREIQSKESQLKDASSLGGQDHARNDHPAPDVTPEGITRPRLKLLNTLSEIAAIGRDPAPRAMLAAWLGVTQNSGGFSNNLSALNVTGLIFYPTPGFVRLTASGRRLVTVHDVPTAEDVRERIISALAAPRSRILKIVMATSNGISREDLARHLGVVPNSGGFSNNISAMRTAGLIDYPSQGVIKAAEWLFIE